MTHKNLSSKYIYVAGGGLTHIQIPPACLVKQVLHFAFRNHHRVLVPCHDGYSVIQSGKLGVAEISTTEQS